MDPGHRTVRWPMDLKHVIWILFISIVVVVGEAAISGGKYAGSGGIPNNKLDNIVAAEDGSRLASGPLTSGLNLEAWMAHVSELLEMVMAKQDILSQSIERIECSCEPIKVATGRPHSPSSFQMASGSQQEHQAQGQQQQQQQDGGHDQQDKQPEVTATNSPQKRDAFRFNKLAPASSNEIVVDTPASDRKWEWIGLTSGEQPEELASTVRDHLASLRLGQARLLARQTDHSYQYNWLNNQLALIRDECWLAASSRTAASSSSTSSIITATTSSNSNGQSAPETTEREHEPKGPLPAGFRSSEIAMFARAVAEELESNGGQLAAGRCRQQIADQANSEPESARWARETNKRLDEISSVAKQSARLLSRLAQADASNVASWRRTGGTSSVAPLVELAYNNSMPPEAAGLTRRFEQRREPKKSPDQRSNCSTRTIGLVRPTGCLELQRAGANCTGQYYVFVNSTIRHLYCDMGADEPGWTLILRRLNKSLLSSQEVGSHVVPVSPAASTWLQRQQAAQLDFNQSLATYRLGFGELSQWSEFFVGLDLLNQLLQSASGSGQAGWQLRADLETSSGQRLTVRWANFSLSGAAEGNFTLHLGPCDSGSLCEPVSRSNGSQFALIGSQLAPDLARGFGWWSPVAAASDSSSIVESGSFIGTGPMESLMWRPSGWRHAHEPLRRLVLKIRPLDSPEARGQK